MFTGLIETVGIVAALQRKEHEVRITLTSPQISSHLEVGDSVSVNGACLTAVTVMDQRFTALATSETLRRTALGQLSVGDRVNLERALCLGDRLDGHLVLGHIDGVGQVRSLSREGQSLRLEVIVPRGLLPMVVPKGSIAVDGVSLTVVDVTADSFSVALIPHTLSATTLSERHPGDLVNLETDIIGKYVARLLGVNVLENATGDQVISPSLNETFLREHGFA